MKISVVIPTYNRRESLIRSVISCFDQIEDFYEVIVVDDCSDICVFEVLSDISDLRLKIFKLDKNSGAPAARNFGMDQATGDFIALLDSDDEFCPEKVSELKMHLGDKDKKVIYYSSLYQRRSGKDLVRPTKGIRAGQDPLEYILIDDGLISTITLVFPKIFSNILKFDTEIKRHQDYDFCLNASQNGFDFYYIDKPLSIFNDDSDTGRITFSTGFGQSYDWFSSRSHFLTENAKIAFKSRVLSSMPGVNKFSGIKWVFSGFTKLPNQGLFSLVRSIIRVLFPRVYKIACSSYVALYSRIKS